MNQQKVFLAPFYMLAATFIGLGDAFYLAYEQYLNLIPSCALGGCEIVLTSVYAKFMGLPLSYYGLVFYGYMACLAVLLIIEPQSRALRLAALAYTGIAFALSLVFIFYIQLMLIHALCLYCALSMLTTGALFGLSVWHFRATRGI
jgi:uncharacterized membrane protein